MVQGRTGFVRILKGSKSWLIILSCSSFAARSSPPTSQKVWHPSHGIVFGGSPGPNVLRSMSTTVLSEISQDIDSRSRVEASYFMAASEIRVEQSSGSAVSGISPKTLAELEPAEEALPKDTEQDELPRSATSFKMSEDSFRVAKKAAPGSSESFWSHTLYRGPAVDGVEPKVKVHYCKSKHTTERVLQQYFVDKNVLGFDIEWKAETNRNGGIKKNVSLIQLAGEDRIGLFHIALYPGDKVEDLVAPSLKKIMEDPSITKVGVAIKADCTRLRKFLDIHAQGIFELSHLYKLVKFSSSKDFKLINKKLVSLAVQVQEHLHLPMFKGEVRGSDWSQALAMDQIVYAASDSYAGIHLYDTLELKRKSLSPTPPRPYHAEENKPIRLAEGVEIPTDDELEPEEQLIPTSASKGKYVGKLSPSYLASTADNLELDPDFDVQALSPTQCRGSKSPPKPTPQKDPLVLEAESLSATYRQSHPNLKCTPSSLRCYYLWHTNPSLSLAEIAALLREVPLQTNTVVNYILEAVKTENLPFAKERLKSVLEVLPKEVAWGRFRTLARAVEDGKEK